MRMRYFISFEVLHYLINVFKCKHCFIVYITQNTNKIRFETITLSSRNISTIVRENCHVLTPPMYHSQNLCDLLEIKIIMANLLRNPTSVAVSVLTVILWQRGINRICHHVTTPITGSASVIVLVSFYPCTGMTDFYKI